MLSQGWEIEIESGTIKQRVNADKMMFRTRKEITLQK